jgi:Zn/Cd-binding protein ZinT
LIAKGDHYTHKKIERKNEILYDISSIKLQEVMITFVYQEEQKKCALYMEGYGIIIYCGGMTDDR